MRDPTGVGKDSELLCKGGSDGGSGGGGGGGHTGGAGASVGRGGWKDVEDKVEMDSSMFAPTVLGTSDPSATKNTCVAGTIGCFSEPDQKSFLPGTSNSQPSSSLGGRV